jgi:hypothetical protein
MSRHPVELKWNTRHDANGVIGYDLTYRTFFVQGFPDNDGRMQLWIGSRPREHLTIASLLERLNDEGVTVISVSQHVIDEMLTEAAEPRTPDYRDRWLELPLGVGA